MKISVVIFVLSTISIAAANFTTVASEELTVSTYRGITLYYTNFTDYIQLVCTCSNELILWLANGSVCQVFLEHVLFEKRNPLCENSSSQYLILHPPFVLGPYLCIGSGKGDACVKRWVLLPKPQPTAAPKPQPTSPPSLAFIRAAASRTHLWLPLIFIVVFGCHTFSLTMRMLLLLAIIASTSAQSLHKPLQIYAKVGDNLTLQSHEFHNSSLMKEVSWYVELWDDVKPTSTALFMGSKLCQFKEDGSNNTWNYPSLHFNCANKSLHLFNLNSFNSGLYNVKVTNNTLEHNTYFNLQVISIPKPQCMVTSFYIAVDYCYIEINCTNSKYPNKVLYNGITKAYYNSARGGKHTLPEHFYTLIDYHGVQANFSYYYPFNSLCKNSGRAPHSAPRFVPRYGPQPARLLGVRLLSPPPYEENPDKDSDDAYEKAMAVVVIAAVVCSLVILAALLFLCYWRRRLRQRRRRGPQLMMTNQL
ncbi:E3 CR1 alpha-beta [Cynomolgus adenovirus 1]|uniref:E3 CR1 alpha-beta n=1 Tax=Cynomolgus adenovirus 1 TaxID=507488 RepID=A0A1C8EG82_9ADEN|nr:E3 CR1 alpha-beta [Cynomolgus adenovirus 1]ALM55130.1 E3 CR1 alpha-beta [Cynomolgus adenovirus 1]